MKRIKPVSRSIPAKAYYYNISLTQKLSEIVTLVSLVESIFNTLFPRS